MNATPATTRLRQDGNGHAKIVDGQKEAPTGPDERNWIHSVFAEALRTLNTGGKAMTMSDLQALLCAGCTTPRTTKSPGASLAQERRPGIVRATMNRAEQRGTVQRQRLS